MIPLIKNIKDFARRIKPRGEKEATEAYDLWSSTYDEQPGNLMLDLDEKIFTRLLKEIDIANKSVADIGCGTGRHWKKIFDEAPSWLTGFDVSEGMLHKLKLKFPEAQISRIADNSFKEIPAASYDIIISTLTVAHINNIDEVLNAWCRLIKQKGELIITDFHPDALAKGGKRTFIHNKRSLSVTNYIHPLVKLENILYKNGFVCKHKMERYVDYSVKEYYIKQNALDVFEKFEGMPVIYGMHFKRT